MTEKWYMVKMARSSDSATRQYKKRYIKYANFIRNYLTEYKLYISSKSADLFSLTFVVDMK